MSPSSEQIALVTGAASGIGRGLAEALAAQGFRVVVADLDAGGAQAVAGALTAAGHRAEAAALDVRDGAAFAALVDGIYQRMGRLDLFFNNAGVGGTYGEVQDLSLADWRALLDVNLHGVVNGIAAVYPRMVRQGSGHIVNTASGLGLIPAPMAVPYATSKFAVVGLSTSLRAEARALGVRVSAVCPGFIDTGIFRKTTYKNLDPKKVQALMPKTMSPAACAKVILAGVRADRAIIPVTGLAWLGWWVWRLCPSLVLWFAERQVAQVRALRAENGAPASKN